jgi:iron complex outermembrane receptor protein
VKLSASGPLSATVGGGLSAAWVRHGFTMTNALAGGPDGNDLSRATLRGQLAWRPSERLKVRFIAGYSRVDDDEGESDVVLVPGARSTAIAESLRRLGLASDCFDNEPRNRVTCSTATNTLELEAIDLTLIGAYQLPNGWELTSITGWDRYRDRRNDDDTMQLSTPLLFFHDSEKGTTVQEELRLSSAPQAPMPWLAGVFYYTNQYERGTRGKRAMFGPVGAAAFDPFWQSTLGIPLALPGQQGLLDSRQRTDYVGVFGQFTWRFNERFSLVNGARWQTDEKRASIDNSVTVPGASVVSLTLTPATSPAGPVNGVANRSFAGWAWSVTPQYRVSDNLMFYAMASRGVKAGGFNIGFGNAPLAKREFGDERSDNYALGTRGTFADGRGRVAASVFHTTYKDYQDAAFASAQFTVGNVGRVTLKGAELDGRFEMGEHTRADLAVSLADLVYARNTTAPCYPGRAPDGTAPGACDLTGAHPIDAPKWSTHLGLEHVRAHGSAELFTRFDWSWMDAYSTSLAADPRLTQRPVHLLGLRWGVRFHDYEVVLAGENLLNEQIVYIDSVMNFFNDASYQSFLGDARRYSVTFRAHFGAE